MLEIHEFAPVQGKQLSPFCYKVEIFCQLAEIPFLSVADMPNKSPTGKLPFIVDESQIIPDSGHILAYLKNKEGYDLDNNLNEEQHALGHLINRICEESLIFSILFSRWIDDDNWPQFRDLVFGSMPRPLKAFLPGIFRKNIKKSLHLQGIGRLSKNEIYQFGIADLKSLSALLKQRPFAVTDKPTSYDASLYAFIAILHHSGLRSDLSDYVTQQSSFLSYLQFMQKHLIKNVL